jgi:hypothetical protein
MSSLYKTLTTSYGLSKDNIYVIYGKGVSEASFANGSHIYAANKDASTGKYTLETVFDELGGKMGANDHLLFYTFDHGSGLANYEYSGNYVVQTNPSAPSNHTEESLCGWNSSLNGYDFIPDEKVAACVEKIQNGYVSMVFAQCFSGGILEEILDPITGAKKISTNAHLFGMVEANHYEYGWFYQDGSGSFAKAFADSLAAGYSTTNNLYTETVKRDPFAVRTSYTPNAGTQVYAQEHPWSAGENFSIFTQSSGNAYAAAGFGNLSSNTSGDLLITNTASSDTDALELLAGNRVYINYTYSNPQNAAVNATVTIYGRNETPETFVISDAGTGSLATNFDLGVFGAGAYDVNVELFVGEDYLIFSDAFIVLAQSADIADTLATTTAITFDNNTWTTTSSIGDGSYGGKDVDIYQIVASDTDINKTLVFNTIGGQTQATDTYIRLFTAAGVELAHSILSGQNVMSSLYYTITTVGTYYLGISALDNTSYFPETPNSGVAGKTGTYQLSGEIVDTRPDLSMYYDFSWIDNIIWTTSATDNNRVTPTSNEDMYVNYKFFNAGYAAAGAVNNRITITGSSYSVSHDFTSSSIDVGDFQSLPQNYNWGKLAAGDYTITVTLDVDNAINELNESNNTASWNFTVTEPLPLPAPANLRVTQQAKTTLMLDWSDVDGATGYVLQRETSTNTWENVYTGTDSQFAVEKLIADTTYSFRVKAVNSATYSEKFSAKTLSNDTFDIPIITKASIDPNTNKVKIEWNNMGAGYYYFILINGRPVSTTAQSANFYETDGSKAFDTATCIVYCQAPSGELIGSLPMVAISPNSQLPKLKIASHTITVDGKIELKWDIQGAAQFFVFRNDSPAFIKGIDTQSWIDTNPKENNQYKLYVNYVDAEGNSTWVWSTPYVVLNKPAAQAAATPNTLNKLDVFWSGYDLNLLDDVLTI